MSKSGKEMLQPKLIGITIRGRKILSIALMICNLWFLCSCSQHRSVQDDINLKQRISEFYSCLQEGAFDRAWGYLAKEARGTKQDYVEQMAKFRIRIVDYKIKSISLRNTCAEVRMAVTAIEDGDGYTENSFDYWLFLNGEWYAKSIGRITSEDSECEP